MREPAFWWRDAGLTMRALAPLGLTYGAVAARRMAAKGTSAGLPVICVGNFTLGGAGKTPTVIMLARMLADAGMQPFCLSRGYGGNAAGPKINVTGPYLEGKGAFVLQMHPLKDAEDARSTVEYWIAQGVTSFKAYMNITRAEPAPWATAASTNSFSRSERTSPRTGRAV